MADSESMSLDPPQDGAAMAPPNVAKKSKKRTNKSQDSPSSDDEMTDKEIINIDFEFFSPLEHDFHGIKLLLRQLFDADSHLLDLSALTELILSQENLGTTVKVDGREGDPYSFLSLINVGKHGSNAAVRGLLSYILERAGGSSLEGVLKPYFSDQPPSNVGVILSERLINMPPDISPPAFNMLLEEVKSLVAENEPYNFTHYLLLSKVYSEIISSLDDPNASRPQKRQKASKKSSSSSNGKVFDFHPEDAFFLSAAEKENSLVYKYKHEPPESAADAKRAFQDFGIMPKGRMVFLEKDAFERAVGEMQGWGGNSAQ